MKTAIHTSGNRGYNPFSWEAGLLSSALLPHFSQLRPGFLSLYHPDLGELALVPPCESRNRRDHAFWTEVVATEQGAPPTQRS